MKYGGTVEHRPYVHYSCILCRTRVSYSPVLFPSPSPPQVNPRLFAPLAKLVMAEASCINSGKSLWWGVAMQMDRHWETKSRGFFYSKDTLFVLFFFLILLFSIDESCFSFVFCCLCFFSRNE